MDVVLIILGFIFIVIGFWGCILPGLPGPPLGYLGLLLLHFTERVQFSTSFLIIWLCIVLVVTLLDYLVPVVGAKRFGGSKYGTWGTVIGTIVGMFFMPLGVFLCPFLGALIGELMTSRPRKEAFVAAIGAFAGFLIGTMIKIVVALVMGYYFVAEILKTL